MGYLFFQILIWILLAFGLGGIVGWLLRGFTHAFQDDEKNSEEQSARGSDHIMVALLKSELSDYKKRVKELEKATDTTAPAAENTKPKPQIDDAWRPEPLTEPKGVADDLKKVRGIGPKIEKTLNDLGIFHYYQIAALSEENIPLVEQPPALSWSHRAGSVGAADPGTGTTEYQPTRNGLKRPTRSPATVFPNREFGY